MVQYHVRKNGRDFKCQFCGKSFYRPLSLIKRGVTKYCSFKCYGNSKVGIPNLHNRHKGNIVTFNCEECGKAKTVRLAFYKKARHHFCSVGCSNVYLGRIQSGKAHWNWKGGITPKNHRLRNTPRYKKWRNAVYKKDNWTCRKCDTKCKSKTIVAHHVKSFEEYQKLRYSVKNGLTLCRGCHKKVHKEIGIDTRFSLY